MLTTPSGGPAASAHPSLTELADAAEGLLDDSRSAELRMHLHRVLPLPEQRRGAAGDQRHAWLPLRRRRCRPTSRSGWTGCWPGRPSADHASRVETPGSGSARPARVTLGAFGADRPRRPARRILLPALAAAAAAAVVGFGAYVASASAGLNEPPVVAAVSSSNLGVQAGVFERDGLDPHRFSRAWHCARQVTDGRIVGLASSTVDGTPALLVFTRAGATTEVTVVTGCVAGQPSPGQSAPVSRR